MASDLLTGLNEVQTKAVRHMDGPILVVAGAGTGKTTVITRRIAYLIEEKKVNPSSILALTFTDKAAREMEERVDELLPLGVVSTNILTFHALGDLLLRSYGNEIGLRTDYTILSDFAQRIFIQELIEKSNLKYFRPLGDPFSLVGDILQHFSRLKDENIGYKQYSNYCNNNNNYEKSEEGRLEQGKDKELAGLYAGYVTSARAAGKLDFGDQIQCTIELLKSRPNIAKVVSNTYKYILVDEYQDTNTAQNILLNLLLKTHTNVMVVGDDDQSIYRFRGAAVENILSFMAEYKDAKQLVLRHNYRSTSQILDASYRLIVHNNPNRLEVKNKINKKLIAASSGNPVRVINPPSIIEESEQVVQEIKKLIDNGAEPKDIAILLRKNNQARLLTPFLARETIPYSVSQNINLLERGEIKLLLNFTRYLNDQNNSQALYGLLASGVLVGVSQTELVKLATQARRKHESLHEVVLEQAEFAKTMEFIEEFRQMLPEYSTGELLYKFLQDTGYLRKLTQESESSNEAALSVQNLAQFFRVVKDFENAAVETNLHAFWHYVADLDASGVELYTAQSPLDQNQVSIMTVHKAKGLEFDHVFLIDMVQNTFPATRRSDALQIPEALMPKKVEGDWHVAEERRLCYVALTRAKKTLILSFSYDHGGVRSKKPSQFIAEALQTTPAQQQQVAPSPLAHIAQFDAQPKLPIDPLSVLVSDGWLHLSVNQVADYVRSPLEFWYFHVLQLPKGPFHSLIYGTSIHAAIETYYRAKLADQKVTLTDMVESFETAWQSEGFVSKAHEIDRKKAATKVLTSFYKHAEQKKEKPEAIEQPFLLTIPELKVKISGRYDAVFTGERGIEIRDFKTGNVDTEKKALTRLKDNVQLGIYAYAWDKSNKQKVTATSLHFVEHDILVANTTFDHEKTLALVTKVVNNIRDKKFSDKGQSRENFDKLI